MIKLHHKKREIPIKPHEIGKIVNQITERGAPGKCQPKENYQKNENLKHMHN